MFFRFLKLPKNQSFEYKPRYYDARKEDLEARLKRARREGGDDPEAMKSRITSGIRGSYYGHRGLRKKYVFRSNLLLVAIIAVLILITYILLSVYLPELTELMN